MMNKKILFAIVAIAALSAAACAQDAYDGFALGAGYGFGAWNGLATAGIQLLAGSFLVRVEYAVLASGLPSFIPGTLRIGFGGCGGSLGELARFYGLGGLGIAVPTGFAELQGWGLAGVELLLGSGLAAWLEFGGASGSQSAPGGFAVAIGARFYF